MPSWNKAKPPTAHEEAECLRGTEKFGKTRTVVAPMRIRHPQPPPLLDVTARPTYIPDYATPRFRLTPRHFAYVKIAEGCNHPCSFCIIPRMRGSHRSRTQADVVAEAKALLADGVKELNLISQDSTYYGLDLRPNHSRAISSPEKFSAAAKSLAADATTHLHPAARAECVAGRFLDSPALHAPGALDRRTDPDHRRMSQGRALRGHPAAAHPREHAGAHAARDLAAIHRGPARSASAPACRASRCARRSSSVFPARRRRASSTLLDFIRETKFERLGVFAYSQEDGTRAGAMAGQLADKVKQRRRELAMAAQHEVAVGRGGILRRPHAQGAGGRRGQRETIAGRERVSSWEHGLMRDAETSTTPNSRAATSSPAARPTRRTLTGAFTCAANWPVGEFARVKIIGHTDYDLIAEPAETALCLSLK